jgi:glycerol-3-phosphate dehydrogenase (NAD(P)+)
MREVAVIGAGKWGQALAFALGKRCDVVITSRHRRDIAGFVTLDEALEREWIVMAIPAQAVREWLRHHYGFKDHRILVASKGIEAETGAFLNEIYEEYVPRQNLHISAARRLPKR